MKRTRRPLETSSVFQRISIKHAGSKFQVHNKPNLYSLGALASMVLLVLFTFDGQANVEDGIEIIDLTSGAIRHLACVLNYNAREEFLEHDDAKQCAYTLRREKQSYRLRKIGYDAALIEETELRGFSCRERIRGRTSFAMCALSPSGENIVASAVGDSGLYLYNVKNASMTEVSTVPQRANVQFLFWVSDSIAGAVIGGSRENNDAPSSSVSLINATSGALSVIYRDASLNWGEEVCAVSLDKRLLALYCESAKELRLLDLAAKKLVATRTLDGHSIDYMCWSADGRYLAYNLVTNGRIEVCSIDPDGKIAAIQSAKATPPIVWGMFFLNPNSLACIKGAIVEKSGVASGPRDYKLEILDVATGQWQIPLSYPVNERVVPIDSNKKLFMVVPVGRN